MANGWVERHRRGWRGSWRDVHGRRHITTTVPTRAEANRLLYEQIDAATSNAKPPRITFGEMAERFLAQLQATPGYRARLRSGLQVPLRLWGDHDADSITPEMVNRWLAASGHKADTKHTYLRGLREVYAFGLDNSLVSANPPKRAKAPAVPRSERLMPFESWAEVERVAAEAGRWEAFITLAVDTGARPGELIRLEHRHIDGHRCYLPGTKTRRAQRVVTLTDRGLAAYRSITREAGTPLVFHTRGMPLDLHNWRVRVWAPALELAGLPYRAPYQMRHTFAYFSLRAGVPLSDLAVEMGHSSIKLSHDTYGHWHDDLGERAASLRAKWAADQDLVRAAA